MSIQYKCCIQYSGTIDLVFNADVSLDTIKGVCTMVRMIVVSITTTNQDDCLVHEIASYDVQTSMVNCGASGNTLA